MPQWLVIAITAMWLCHVLFVIGEFMNYSKMSYHARRLYKPSAVTSLLVVSIVPFTIFWWSWVLFG